MSLLLDTHVVLWWLADDPALDPRARHAIAADPEVFVSAASVWEIAIKRSLGKLDAPANVVGAIEATGFAPLPVALRHAEQAGGLPPHHRDPFDRMLVAQARLERLTLVTADGRIAAYDVQLLDASGRP